MWTVYFLLGAWQRHFSVQFSSVTQSCLTLYDHGDCSMPGFPVHHQFPQLAQTHVHWVTDAIQQSYPLSSPSPPAFNLSQHQGLYQESVLCIRWPKYWTFSFSISPTNDYLGLISFRTDWLDLLAVQGSLQSPLWRSMRCINEIYFHNDSPESSPTPQFKSINSWHSAFFMVQFSHPYITTGKTIALDLGQQSNISAF